MALQSPLPKATVLNARGRIQIVIPAVIGLPGNQNPATYVEGPPAWTLVFTINQAQIINPVLPANRALAVRAGQPVRLVSNSSTNWWTNTNGAGWVAGPTSTSVFVWTAAMAATASRRFTFDDVQIGVGPTSPPTGTTISVNVMEAPPVVLQVTPRWTNDAVSEPPAMPFSDIHDDPPLGTPLAMPGANRDGLGTALVESPPALGGPASLVASYGPGLFTDVTGLLGVRTPVGTVRGLGAFPRIASYHYGGTYFNYDFGKSRTLGLTRRLYDDVPGGGGNVAIVRGDGRRTTYRLISGTYYPQAVCDNTLTLSSGVYTETTPIGTQYLYDSSGYLQKIVDRTGNPVYYTYDSNSPKRLQQISGVPGAGASGLVPYLAYDATSGLLNNLTLQDLAAPANNRTTYFVYDLNKNLTNIIGPELCITYFTYDGTAQYLLSVTDAEGFVWSAGYDGSNRVQKIQDALALNPGTAYFAYDATTPLTTLLDRAGKATYFQFNAFGSPTTVLNPGTPADYHGFDGSGNLTSSQNRLGSQWTYEYDGSANRISSTDPLGARSYFAYDANDELRTYIDPLGRNVYLYYDGKRNRTSWVDPLGNTSYYQYQSNGLLLCKQDRRKAFTYFAFDAASNLQTVTDALGYQTNFAYDSAGDRTAAVDPLGRISYWGYDKKSRVISTKDPLGAVRAFAYNDRCNLVTETRPPLNGSAVAPVLYYQYDGNSNRTQALDPLSNATYYRYDAEERILGQKNGLLNETTSTYDVLGRRQQTIDPLGGTSYFAYDAAHEPTLTQDPLNNSTYMDYDLAGRVAHQKDALLNTTYMGYDLKGNRVLTTDARGNSTTFAYDAHDWLSSTTNAIGAVSYMGYDPERNRTLALDPLLKPTYFIYDLAGRMTGTRDAVGSTTYLGYDGARQTVLRLDELAAPTYFAYDLAGRQQITTDAYQNQTYTGYDQGGNRVLALDELGTPTYFTYDVGYRPTIQTDTIGNTRQTVYDVVNNVLTSVNERGFATYFTYDSLNRRSTEKDPVHFLATYHGYDAASNQVLDLDQLGFAVYYTYDALNRQQNMVDRRLARTYYAFDPVGNRVETRVEVASDGSGRRSTYFQYDPINRVTNTIDALAGVAYMGYDAANNRTLALDQEGRPTYFAFDLLNREHARLDAFLNCTYTNYDARSQVLQRIDPVGRTAYFSYDLKRRTQTQSNALGQVSYMGYDARSSRVLFVNPRSFPLYYHFDALRRVSTTVDTYLGVRYFGYDPVGNQVLGLDELNNPTYFVYDGLNRLSKSIDAALAVTYMGYDPVSNLVRRIDADGRIINMGYDGARRLSTLMPDVDPWIYYAYDAVSARTEFRDETGLSIHAVDKLDRLTSKTNISGTVYYQYDRSGKKILLTDPVERVSYYAHDAAGRLSLVLLDPDFPRPVYYGYDASGLLTHKALPSDTVLSYFTYDAAGRLSQLENYQNGYGTPLSYYVYQRNALGAIDQFAIVDQGTWVYYLYDHRDRLTSEHQLAGLTPFNYAYTWDLASNRLTQTDGTNTITWHYDARNLPYLEYNGSAATYYSYDQSQRMTQFASPSDARYFSYNQRNMVTGLFHASTGSADAPRYFGYSGAGERLIVMNDSYGKSLAAVASGPAYWAYDGGRLILDRFFTGSVTYYDFYRHNYSANQKWDLLDYQRGGVHSYPAFDSVGSTKQLRNSDGVTTTYEYTKDGDTLFVSASALPNRDRFMGRLRMNLQIDLYLQPSGDIWISHSARGVKPPCPCNPKRYPRPTVLYDGTPPPPPPPPPAISQPAEAPSGGPQLTTDAPTGGSSGSQGPGSSGPSNPTTDAPTGAAAEGELVAAEEGSIFRTFGRACVGGLGIALALLCGIPGDSQSTTLPGDPPKGPQDDAKDTKKEEDPGTCFTKFNDYDPCIPLYPYGSQAVALRMIEDLCTYEIPGLGPMPTAKPVEPGAVSRKCKKEPGWHWDVWVTPRGRGRSLKVSSVYWCKCCQEGPPPRLVRGYNIGDIEVRGRD